jgi:large subunit ribosomal protein L21
VFELLWIAQNSERFEPNSAFPATLVGFGLSTLAFCGLYPIFALQFFKKETMYAIVDIAGQQYKVAKDQYVYAPKMDGETGATVSFDKVLLMDSGKGIEVGAPVIVGAKVSGKILEHVKADKVIIFKKKRRKGYAVKNGHRQQYTKVQIESIG